MEMLIIWLHGAPRNDFIISIKALDLKEEEKDINEEETNLRDIPMKL